MGRWEGLPRHGQAMKGGLVCRDEGRFSETKVGKVRAGLGANLANDARHELVVTHRPNRVHVLTSLLARLVVFAVGQTLVEVETRVVPKTPVINLGTSPRNCTSRTAIHKIATRTRIITSTKGRPACTSRRTRRTTRARRTRPGRTRLFPLVARRTRVFRLGTSDKKDEPRRKESISQHGPKKDTCARREAPDAPHDADQSGMLPCFFAGFLSRLSFSKSSARSRRIRSCRGEITSSMNPSSAAL